MELRKIKKNKKASIMDLLIWLILAFVVTLFFALWIYGFNRVTTSLIDIDTGNPSVNISDAATKTFGQVDPMQERGLHVIAFVMIFMSGISILVTSFLVKTHPAFLVVYIFVIIVAVITSVYLSNQYETLMTDDIVGTEISEFTAASFIMLNLPVWTTVIGIFGAIFLFAGILRDRGLGGSLT